MALEILQRDREGITLLDLKGRITAGPEVGSLRTLVEELSQADGPKIVFNMQHVDFIDSTGLGAMVMCQKHLQRNSGKAKLAFLNRRNLELLLLTRIDTIFEVFDDETDAVNSFFPEREIRRFDILSFVQTLKEEEA